MFILKNVQPEEKRRERERKVGRREISLILRRVVYFRFWQFVVEICLFFVCLWSERRTVVVVVVVVVTNA